MYNHTSDNMGKKRKTKKRKLKLGRLLLALIILVFIVYLIKLVFRFPIKNIFVEGNTILSDQEVIDLAKLENYPSIFKY